MPYLEESLEWWKQACGDIFREPLQSHSYFYSRRGALSKFYGSQNLLVLIAFSGVDGIDDGRIGVISPIELPHAHDSDGDVPVLVHINEVIEQEERCFFRTIRSTHLVWLDTLDKSLRLSIDPIESTTFDLPSEGLRTRAYGEHVVFGGNVASRFDKVPHQVIETGTEILHHIPNDDSKVDRDFGGNIDLERAGFITALWISDNSAWMRFKVRLNAGRQFLKVLIGTFELEPRALEGCHVAS